MERWELEDRIERIVRRNCEEIPYEGTEVNKSGIIREVLDLFDELEKSRKFIEKFNEKNGQNFEDCLY